MFRRDLDHAGVAATSGKREQGMLWSQPREAMLRRPGGSGLSCLVSPGICGLQWEGPAVRKPRQDREAAELGG